MLMYSIIDSKREERGGGGVIPLALDMGSFFFDQAIDYSNSHNKIYLIVKFSSSSSSSFFFFFFLNLFD